MQILIKKVSSSMLIEAVLTSRWLYIYLILRMI